MIMQAEEDNTIFSSSQTSTNSEASTSSSYASSHLTSVSRCKRVRIEEADSDSEVPVFSQHSYSTLNSQGLSLLSSVDGVQGIPFLVTSSHVARVKQRILNKTLQHQQPIIRIQNAADLRHVKTLPLHNPPLFLTISCT